MAPCEVTLAGGFFMEKTRMKTTTSSEGTKRNETKKSTEEKCNQGL